MDKLQIPSPSNGYPFNWEDIEFTLGLGSYDRGLIQAIEGLLLPYGDNLIVSGCEITGSDISEGWVFLNGELIKVDAHTATGDYFEKVTSYNSDGSKQTQTGSTENAYLEIRATATASSGNLEVPVSDRLSIYTGEKIIEIGPWSIGDTIDIPHNMDFDKIIGIESILIVDDYNLTKIPLPEDEYYRGVQGENIRLLRSTQEDPNDNYIGSVLNRGWIILKCLP